MKDINNNEPVIFDENSSQNQIYGAVKDIADIFHQDINYLVKLKAQIEDEIDKRLKAERNNNMVIRSDGRNIWTYYNIPNHTKLGHPSKVQRLKRY